MLIRTPPDWAIPESEVTPQALALDRRAWLARSIALGLAPGMASAAEPGGALLATTTSTSVSVSNAPATPSFATPPKPNPAHQAPEPLSDPQRVFSFTNFFEFGAGKDIRARAERLPLRPWTLTIDGLVKQPQVLDVDRLLSRMANEQRIYRHRCIEAWSMVVPWDGFALKDLVALAEPLSSARYVSFTTFGPSKHFSAGFWRFWQPWPYLEAVTMAEAMSELPFIATGLYGSPLLPQNGAPLRLVLPWKYGFKSAKSLVRMSFHAERPRTFWERSRPSECGFWANVNPQVPHPHWSQATEQRLGAAERIPTQLFNGYGAQVAHLYHGLEHEMLWR
jgi:sulfoxide reductase catalytic subunit YedY